MGQLGSIVSLCRRWIVETFCSCRGWACWPQRSRYPPRAPRRRHPARTRSRRETATPAFLFHDEFDGPAGSAPDPSKWTVATARETIKNPVFWDRPENMGQYRNDRRNVFLDGKSNLVIRATKENGKYFSGKLTGTWRGGIGLTWEARVKFDCLTLGCWPAWWLLNNDPVRGGEIDLVEWYGNGSWPSGSTVHARLDGTSFATQPFDVDSAWHVWRCTWNDAGMYFWRDYVDGHGAVLHRSGELARRLAVQRPGLPAVPDAQPGGRRLGRRRSRRRHVSGGHARRLGARLVTCPSRVSSAPSREHRHPG